MRTVQVDSGSRKKPHTVQRLAEWQYLEMSLHRMLCGWGRNLCDWEDKVALARHVWDQAECVRRLRDRLVQFPGTVGNLELPVSDRFQHFANAVLLAPSFEDAVDGIFQDYVNWLVQSYLEYAESAHPVHDAPTLAVISEIVRTKEQMRLWLRDYRRRHPHSASSAYRAALQERASECRGGNLDVDSPARPVGVGTSFRPALRAAHPAGTTPTVDIMPALEAHFSHDVEIRRLFWCYGYLLEMNLAEEQLIWLYDAHEMPWDYIQDVTRHMWDESRHGDSGHSRLLDFGISIQEIGFPYYDQKHWGCLNPTVAEGQASPMAPQDLYDAAFFIGMVAETGHFTVKHEAYDDFKAGGDLESAEMMLFDIIDETTHVQYAHRWLPLLAERAGVANMDFRVEGAKQREKLLLEATERADANRDLASGPAWDKVQMLLAKMREHLPLANAGSCPVRSYKPM